MENGKSAFEKLIKDDRAAHEQKLWQGTFLEYLERVREDPSVPKLAHARIYDVIMRPGTADILETDDPRVKRLYKDESRQGLQLLPRRVLRHREDDRADRPLLPLGLAEGRGEPAGPLPHGPGRLRQELAGREAAARPRGERRRSTRSTAARCSRSRSTSSRATCARSSRRCSACTSRATSARCAASA